VKAAAGIIMIARQHHNQRDGLVCFDGMTSRKLWSPSHEVYSGLDPMDPPPFLLPLGISSGMRGQKRIISTKLEEL
jgi:hypothetical protein